MVRVYAPREVRGIDCSSICIITVIQMRSPLQTLHHAVMQHRTWPYTVALGLKESSEKHGPERDGQYCDKKLRAAALSSVPTYQPETGFKADNLCAYKSN